MLKYLILRNNEEEVREYREYLAQLSTDRFSSSYFLCLCLSICSFHPVFMPGAEIRKRRKDVRCFERVLRNRIENERKKCIFDIAKLDSDEKLASLSLSLSVTMTKRDKILFVGEKWAAQSNEF